MRIAILTTDSREHYRDYLNPHPYFGTAPEALIQGLSRLGELEVHVISCLQHPVQSPEKLAPQVWYHGLRVPKFGWLRSGYFGCIRAVRKKLAEVQPDLVHGQGTERDCGLSAVFSGRPNVITIHGNVAELARLFGARPGSYPWVMARLENFALPRANGVFCNSRYTEALVRPRAKCAWLVPNPLRAEFFRPIPEQTSGRRPRLLNVGVISANKRQIELLEVAQRLRARGMDFEFRFVGLAPASDRYAREFLQRIRNAGAFVSHHGVKDTQGLVEEFDQAAALVHFSQVESFGLVVAEALARQLKVFAARSGGVVDIIEGVEAVELFETTDFAGLEDAVAAWIASGCPRPAHSAALMCQRYGAEGIARRHLEIYKDVLQAAS